MDHGDEQRKKTILLVNTGSQKKKFTIQRLKRLGLNVIILNKEKNWAAPYVDDWIIADTYNHRESLTAISQYLQNNPERKFDGVITFWEDDVLLTSKISDRLDLIGIPHTIAKQVRNKYLFRDFCSKNGIKAPRFKLLRSVADLDNIGVELNFPVVIKPAYGSSSAYVVKCNTPEDLSNSFQFIKKNISSDSESSLSDGLDIFVEEYLDGDEVDIDVLLQNGKIKFYSISDNYNKEWGEFFVDSGQSMPSNLPRHTQDEIIDIVEETLEKIGIQNGCIHYEAKVTRTGIYPLEVNLRLGGDYVYSYNKGSWDIDLIELGVKIALGEYIKEKTHPIPKKYIIGWDIHPQWSGILAELNIDDNLKKQDYLEDIVLYKEVGDPILMPPEGQDQLGWITVSGDNPLDAQDNLKEALKYINFRVVRFDDESSLGKTSRKNRLSSAVINKNLLIKAAKLEKTRRMSLTDQRNLHIGIVHTPVTDLIDQYSTNDVQVIGDTLKERGYKISYYDMAAPLKTAEAINNDNVDLVFNICEMANGSNLFEPHVAALLELMQIPFTGPDYSGLSLALDKIKMKKLLEFHDIPTPKWDYAYEADDEIDSTLRYPLIVKPATTDGSVGINGKSVVTTPEQLRERIAYIINEIKSPALVEEFIKGDEYEICILGESEQDLRVLPLARYIFKVPEGYWPIFNYEMKWEKHEVYNYDNVDIECPPKNINKRLEQLITEMAIDTYRIFNFRDYGRVEVRVDQDGNPYVIEINPNPDMTPSGDFAAIIDHINMSYGDLLEEIIRLAVKRYGKN